MSSELKMLFSAWGDADPDTRRATLEKCTAEPFLYADPNTPEQITSLDAFNDYLQMFTGNMPGANVEVAGVDGHHNHLRATIDFMRDGATMMRGQYFAETAEDGKIMRLIGFIGTGDAE